jgi:hypothetical protein
MKRVWQWLAVKALRRLSTGETSEVLRVSGKKSQDLARALSVNLGPMELLTFLNDMSKTLRGTNR